MHRIAAVAVLLVVAACTSGDDASVPTIGQFSTTHTPTVPDSTTSTSGAATTSTSLAAPSTTTTRPDTDLPGSVCASYAAFVAAEGDQAAAAALRTLSVALGFPRDDALSAAIDVLRGRRDDRSPAAARAELDSAMAGCNAGGGADAAQAAGVIIGGAGGVFLRDGTEVVEADPVGTYFAAFDDRSGGLFSMLEIRGLEIIDHRSHARAVPRDLVLADDARLHDTAAVGGVDAAVVTIWESAGEFGDLVQRLYLAPFDGGDLVEIGVVGDALAGAETVSFAADLFLVTEYELGGPATIYALDSSGNRVDNVPGLPIAVGPQTEPAVQSLQHARLAPDGTSFAYLRVRPSVGAGASGDLRTDVVLQRVADGVEFMSIEIGAPDDLHLSLDFDGQFVIVATRDRLLVVDTTGTEGPELSGVPLEDAAFASFLDSGLALTGDG